MKINPYSKFRCFAAILLCTAISVSLSAQEAAPAIPSAVTPSTKPIAVGLSTGTSAFVGLDGAININRFFNARLGFNYLGYHYKNEAFVPPFEDLKDQQFYLDAKVKMSNLSVLGEFKPFKSGTFRIVAGAGYFFNNQFILYGIANREYLFNEVVFEPDEIGSIKSTWGYKSSISPYGGLAFGRAVPKKRLGFSAEIGTYYKGAPQIDIEATGSLRENVRNGPILTRNFSNLPQYHFLPTFSLRLAYKIM